MAETASPSSILHVFPSFGIGGAQRRTVDLANSILVDKRHVIVALDRDFSAAEGLKFEVRHRLVSLGCKRSNRPELENLRTFRRLVAQYRPEMLITYNWGSIDAALANRIAPLCPHVHFARTVSVRTRHPTGRSPEGSGRDAWRSRARARSSCPRKRCSTSHRTVGAFAPIAFAISRTASTAIVSPCPCEAGSSRCAGMRTRF